MLCLLIFRWHWCYYVFCFLNVILHGRSHQYGWYGFNRTTFFWTAIFQLLRVVSAFRKQRVRTNAIMICIRGNDSNAKPCLRYACTPRRTLTSNISFKLPNREYRNRKLFSFYCQWLGWLFLEYESMRKRNQDVVYCHTCFEAFRHKMILSSHNEAAA